MSGLELFRISLKHLMSLENKTTIPNFKERTSAFNKGLLSSYCKRLKLQHQQQHYAPLLQSDAHLCDLPLHKLPFMLLHRHQIPTISNKTENKKQGVQRYEN